MPLMAGQFGMILTHWIEYLRCPKCSKTGDAELFEISAFNNGFRRIPDGFKVADLRHGKDFYCGTCDIPVAP
jgi:hypothetical protein